MAFWVHVEKDYTIFIVYFSGFKSLESLARLSGIGSRLSRLSRLSRPRNFRLVLVIAHGILRDNHTIDFLT